MKTNDKERCLWVTRDRRFDGRCGPHRIWRVRPHPVAYSGLSIYYCYKSFDTDFYYNQRACRTTIHALGLRALKPGEIVRIPLGKPEKVT